MYKINSVTHSSAYIVPSVSAMPLFLSVPCCMQKHAPSGIIELKDVRQVTDINGEGEFQVHMHTHTHMHASFIPHSCLIHTTCTCTFTLFFIHMYTTCTVGNTAKNIRHQRRYAYTCTVTIIRTHPVIVCVCVCVCACMCVCVHVYWR